jgi:hypothetical protein
MGTFHRAAWTALSVFVLSVPGTAQTLPRGNDWSHGTTLNISGGVAADASETRPLASTAVGWEITPAIAIEGSGYWLDRSGADVFAAALKVQAGLLVPHTAVPFLEAGVGLYRASFDPAASTVPDFYRRRIAANTPGPGATSTFTDPSFILGGGVNIFVTRHIAIRPDVESMIVRRDSQHYVVTAVAVHIAYHFESHPIAPTRRPN